MQRRAAPLGVRLPAGPLAAGWILFTLAGNVLDRFVPPDRYTVLDVVVLLVLYTSVAFLLPVQDAINAINRAEVPDHDPNDRFTVWNWLWIVVGGLFAGLIVLGSLLPDV